MQCWGGLRPSPRWRPKKQFPEHQTDYMETRSGSGFGMGGHGWRWWRCLCSAFVLQPVQNTKDNKTPSATHEHEPKSQAKTWRTEFQPYMLYTLRIFQLLEINKNQLIHRNILFKVIASWEFYYYLFNAPWYIYWNIFLIIVCMKSSLVIDESIIVSQKSFN